MRNTLLMPANQTPAAPANFHGTDRATTQALVADHEGDRHFEALEADLNCGTDRVYRNNEHHAWVQEERAMWDAMTPEELAAYAPAPAAPVAHDDGLPF